MSKAMRADPAHRFSWKDLVAGISVALILIPQSMAYAELAGLPSHHGLYAAALPPIAAAFFASSPYLQTGPVALTALLTLGALVPLAAVGSAEFVGLAALLALVVGVVRMAVGFMRSGWLSYLMSRPMLSGFTSGAAILIVSSQLPGAFGSAPPDGSVLGRAWWAMSQPGSWETTALVLTAVTVALVRGGRLIHPLLPGALLAAGGGLTFSMVTGYTGSTVGIIPSSLPPLAGSLPWSSLPALIIPGAVIALVGFAEAASISRVFATEDRQRWDADREFLSQGAANLAAGLTGGFPVGGSFSRSSVNRLAGATSRWSGLVTGAGVLLFLPFASVLAPLPRAVLSGIVIASVWPLFRPGELFELWRISRPQAIVGWGTFIFTLVLAPNIEQAVLLGVVMAGAVHMWRELTPEVASVREGDTLIVEPKGVLWFGSAPALEDALLARLSEEPDVQAVIIRCGGLGRIDLTGAYGLKEMIEQVEGAGLGIRLEDVPEHARRVLEAIGVGTEGRPSP
ncbi:MAG: SulP family inorganic anion transporter [Longimicrobiales bacterium]|nr:SulP family inorganic anion transporter [Longimicrobiales bacterium]